MADRKNTPRPRSGKASVLSRDEEGAEHLLVVIAHPFGFVSISDGQVLRVMTPQATSALVIDLLDALRAYLPAQPLGGNF